MLRLRHDMAPGGLIIRPPGLVSGRYGVAEACGVGLLLGLRDGGAEGLEERLWLAATLGEAGSGPSHRKRSLKTAE